MPEPLLAPEQLGRLDRMLDVITKVPALHRQENFQTRHLGEGSRHAAREQLAAHPELADVVDCGTAFCGAGWVLFLEPGWYDPVAHGPIDPVTEEHVDWIDGACELLGIDRDEAYDRHLARGIFWDSNSVADIRAWVDYYHGRIDRAELDARLVEQ